MGICYSQRLGEAGFAPSVVSKGDSCDNALAETINGLYKAELINRAHLGRPSNQWSWQLWDGWFGSTTTDCWAPSAISRLQKLRRTITGNSPIRLPRWWPDLNQLVAMNPGAVQYRQVDPVVRCCQSAAGTQFGELFGAIHPPKRLEKFARFVIRRRTWCRGASPWARSKQLFR